MFIWISSMNTCFVCRFYLLGNKDVVAKMGLAQISYSYEYLGVNTGQFVRTELADECFLILTQVLIDL